MSDIQFTLRLEETSHKKIKYISKIENRSLNSQIQNLVNKCITNFEKENGKINVNDDQ